VLRHGRRITGGAALQLIRQGGARWLRHKLTLTTAPTYRGLRLGPESCYA
jgi:hypothetical protein